MLKSVKSITTLKSPDGSFDHKFHAESCLLFLSGKYSLLRVAHILAKVPRLHSEVLRAHGVLKKDLRAERADARIVDSTSYGASTL